MCRRYQEKIVSVRLPNMGLKVSLGSSQVCYVLGVVVLFWPFVEFHSSKLSDSKLWIN